MSQTAASAAAASAAAGGFDLTSLRSLLTIPPEARTTKDILLIARQMSALPCFQGAQGETLIIAAATAHRKMAPPDAVLAAAGETCNAVSVILSGSAEVRFKKTKKDEPAKAHIDDVIEGEWRKTSLLGSVVDVLVMWCSPLARADRLLTLVPLAGAGRCRWRRKRGNFSTIAQCAATQQQPFKTCS
jgi:hypothetical protein